MKKAKKSLIKLLKKHPTLKATYKAKRSKGTSINFEEELMEEVWARNDRLDEDVYALTLGFCF